MIIEVGVRGRTSKKRTIEWSTCFNNVHTQMDRIVKINGHDTVRVLYMNKNKHFFLIPVIYLLYSKVYIRLYVTK